MLAVTFWQSPGDDPGSGWLNLAQGAELGQRDEQGAEMSLMIHLGCRGGMTSKQRCLLQMTESRFLFTVTVMQRHDKPLKIIIIGCFY